MAEFLDVSSGDAPPVVDRIPGLDAERGTTFGAFLNRFSKFLLDETAVKQGLEKINLKMLALVAGRQAQFDMDNPDFPVAPDEKVTPDNLAAALASLKKYRVDFDGFMDHVLSDVLTEIENDHGFGVPGTRKRAVTLTGLVGNDLFRGELIGKGLTWKDPSVNPTHGEFTHRLQWCAGMLELTNILPKTYWSRAFIKIGGFADDDLFDGNRFGLWDAIIDRNQSVNVLAPTPYDTTVDTDFRSPENFQAWLGTPGNRAPASSIRILASFIWARQQKRVGEQTPNKGAVKGYAYPGKIMPPNDAVWGKWAQILFQNRGLSDLGRDEKATLARAWSRLAQLDKGQPRNQIMVILDVDRAAKVDPALEAAYVALGLTKEGL